VSKGKKVGVGAEGGKVYFFMHIDRFFPGGYPFTWRGGGGNRAEIFRFLLTGFFLFASTAASTRYCSGDCFEREGVLAGRRVFSLD
jgi:hypothetical protein